MARGMVMKSKSRTLNIIMNGLMIGKLEKTRQGILTFTYNQKWVNTSGARPISLSLPLTEQTYVGDSVYNYFDNLLPDNPQIRARIQARFQIETNQPFDLLASIGKDCVGAIQIIEGEIPIFEKEIKYEALNEKEVATIMNGYQNNPLGMTDTFQDFRISIAGAQEKSAFLFHKNKWCRPLGGTPTTHIFKLPIGYIKHHQMDLSNSCENEWLCSQIAKAFGLPVAECEILYFKNVKILAVKRFDRKKAKDNSWIMRLPQEDMCQVLGVSPHLKYQSDGGPGLKNIMQLLLGSVNSIEDRDIFYRSQVLFWLLAAIDGHAKNFSIFIKPEGKFQLTPLYDIISAHPLIAEKQLQSRKIKMAMALVGKNVHYHWYTLSRRHFVETAKAINYSSEKAEILLDEMLQQIDSVINNVKDKLPHKFPKNISQSIFDGMRSVKKKLEKK